MLKTVSVYSGAGGMDYGFHLAGFETIFAVDFDKYAIETLNGLLPAPVGVYGDVDTVAFPAASDVDIVIGGPPCQGFSVAGGMDPLDERSRHVWRFLEIVGALQSLITRRINVFNPGVLTVTQVHAGTAFNVIPEFAEVFGTIRAISETTRRMIHEGVRRVAEGIAAAGMSR